MRIESDEASRSKTATQKDKSSTREPVLGLGFVSLTARQDCWTFPLLTLFDEDCGYVIRTFLEKTLGPKNRADRWRGSRISVHEPPSNVECFTQLCEEETGVIFRVDLWRQRCRSPLSMELPFQSHNFPFSRVTPPKMFPSVSKITVRM
jgi:hypothetical protein